MKVFIAVMVGCLIFVAIITNIKIKPKPEVSQEYIVIPDTTINDIIAGITWRFEGNQTTSLFEFYIYPNDSITLKLYPGLKMDSAAALFFHHIKMELTEWNDLR